MDENTLPQVSVIFIFIPSIPFLTDVTQMCHLMIDGSIQVQKVAYGIMRSAAKKRTEHLVIEAGVDIESTAQATLPLELLDIVQRHIDFVSVEDKEEQQVGIVCMSRNDFVVDWFLEHLWLSASLDAYI